MTDWIRAIDDLPDWDVQVLVYGPECGMSVGWRRQGMGWQRDDTGCSALDVSHWRPLPAPPAE